MDYISNPFDEFSRKRSGATTFPPWPNAGSGGGPELLADCVAVDIGLRVNLHLWKLQSGQHTEGF
jgi:hypothetical protein